jgi:hypothetical protein
MLYHLIQSIDQIISASQFITTLLCVCNVISSLCKAEKIRQSSIKLSAMGNDRQCFLCRCQTPATFSPAINSDWVYRLGSIFLMFGKCSYTLGRDLSGTQNDVLPPSSSFSWSPFCSWLQIIISCLDTIHRSAFCRLQVPRSSSFCYGCLSCFSSTFAVCVVLCMLAVFTVCIIICFVLDASLVMILIDK